MSLENACKAFWQRKLSPLSINGKRKRLSLKVCGARWGSRDVDPDYGGMGGDFLYSYIVAQELTKTWFTGLTASLHTDIVVPYINSFGSDELKQKYIPGCVTGDIVTAVAMTEPDAGSDLAGMKTAAVEEDDEVVIDGSKTFISNGIISDIVVVAARDPNVENPYEAISLYVVESGCTVRIPPSCFLPNAVSPKKTDSAKRGRAF